MYLSEWTVQLSVSGHGFSGMDSRRLLGVPAVLDFLLRINNLQPAGFWHERCI